MSWRLATFTPLDTVVANDPRGLDTGGWNGGEGLPPSTVAGALRTAILRESGYRFGAPIAQQVESAKRAAVSVGLPSAGEPQEVTFRCAGPFYTTAGFPELWLPMPRFVLTDEHENGRLTPAAEVGLADDALPCPVLGFEGGRAVHAGPDSRWATLKTVGSLLTEVAGSGGLRASPPRRQALSEFRTLEFRPGHSRGSKGTVEERQLFGRTLLRLNRERGTAFAALVRGAEGLAGPLRVRLGGDGRVAALEVRESPLLEPIEKLREIVETGLETWRGLSVYLATPGPFESGWWPQALAGSGCDLLGAAVGRPVPVSGWDLARKGVAPRPARHAVPAGSVYFLRVNDLAAARGFVDTYHAESLCERAEDRWAGWGFALCGLFDARKFEPRRED